MTLEAVPFELLPRCEDVIRLLTVRVSGKHVALRLEAAASPRVRLVGEPLRVRQILVNLTDNAIKFTERGEVVVRSRWTLPPDEVPLRMVRHTGRRDSGRATISDLPAFQGGGLVHGMLAPGM